MMTERTVHSEDLKRLSRQIFYSAERLVKMLEMNAPLVIIEKERRLLAGRVKRLPVTDIGGMEE